MALFDRVFKRRQERAGNKEAYKRGQEYAQYLGDRVNEFAENRLDHVTVNLLEVFKDRLETVYNDPDHDPKIVAAAELEIFKKQIAEAQKRFWSETQDHLSDELETLVELDLVELLADLIENVTEPRLNALIAGAKVLYDGKIKEIEDKHVER